MVKQADNQIEILKRFSEQANKLMDKKFNSLHTSRMSMSFFADGKVFGKVKSQLPSDDLLKVFLMEFRFFYVNKNNPYNFKKVCNFFIQNNFKKEKVQEWLDAYEHIFLSEGIKLCIGNKNLGTKMIFETIINAGNFHQEGSQKGINLINASPFIEPMAKMKFFDTIGRLRQTICSFNKQIVEKYIEINSK